METVETKLKVFMPDGSIETYRRSIHGPRKIAIQGPPKSGKSHLAATAPRGPKFFYDPAGRLDSLEGMPDVFGKTYYDSVNPSKSTAWDMIEQDTNMFEYHHAKGDPIPGTFIYDDIDILMDRAMRKCLVDGLTQVKKLKAGSNIYLAPANWYPKAELDMVGNLIARGIEMGSDVIAIFHERDEETADSTSEDKKFTGKKSVHPPRAAVFLPLFNEYWRCVPTGDGKYVVHTKSSYIFDGATCLDVEETEEADITKMVNKSEERKRQNG